MALLIRAFQFFSGISVVATAPFAVKFASKREVISRGEGRLVSYKEVVAEQEIIPPAREELKVTEVINVAQKMMDDESGGKNGEKQCFWWPDARGMELFACVYVNNLEKIFLFHYSGRNQKQLKLSKQLNPIKRLTMGNSGSHMYLKEGESVSMTRNVSLTLAWLRKWEADLIPGQHCKITKNDDGRRDHSLICDATNKKGGEAFKKNIHLVSLHNNKYQQEIS